MIVYRIAAPQWANDISGYGAKLFGGRWNSPGLPMLYTSENISLAMLEILINSTRERLMGTFKVVSIHFPDIEIEIAQNLPSNWNTYPHGLTTQNFGDDFLQRQNSLALKLPSCANELEYNLLLNPLHKHFHKVEIKAMVDISFNLRLANY